MDILTTENLNDSCPIGTVELFKKMSTPYINHYCRCEDGEEYNLEWNYFNDIDYSILDPDTICPKKNCQILGGANSREKINLNVILSKKICVKLLKIEKLFTQSEDQYLIVENKHLCPPDYLKCGWLNIHNYLCSINSYSCPINSIKILDKSSVFVNTYYSQELDEDNALFYSFEETNNFLVTNDIFYYYKEFCLNPFEIILPSGSNIWDHWNIKISENCRSNYWIDKNGEKQFHDPRIKQIGQISKQKLFQENKVDEYMDEKSHISFDQELSSDYNLTISFRHSFLYNRYHINNIELIAHLKIQHLYQLSIP